MVYIAVNPQTVRAVSDMLDTYVYSGKTVYYIRTSSYYSYSYL